MCIINTRLYYHCFFSIWFFSKTDGSYGTDGSWGGIFNEACIVLQHLNVMGENNAVNLIKWLLFFPLLLVLDEKSCSDPGGPLNGYRRVVEDTGLLNGRYAKIGTVIAFFCNNSYVLSGNEQRTCQDNGEWSGKQPICIKGSLQSFKKLFIYFFTTTYKSCYFFFY